MSGMLPTLGMSVDVWMDEAAVAIEPHDKSRQSDFARSLLARTTTRLYLPIVHAESVDQRLMSRFLAKVSIEALAQRLLSVDGWRKELLGMEGLRPLRHFARIGNRPNTWDYSRRPLHSPEATFESLGHEFVLLHEFDFVYTTQQELFFVLAIFGEEYALDMGNPNIAGHLNHLKEHGEHSPLYPSGVIDGT
jgi:hypothetical protein